MLFLVIFWFQLFWSPCAFSWSKPPIKSSPEPPIESDYGIYKSTLPRHYFRLPHALERYTRRPDCFRRVAGAIRTRCGELDMDEDERINAAISMTLCEIATAKHYSLPLECRPFSPEGKDPRDPRTRSECVDALSRSAQFWSSYSGYLREIRGSSFLR
ncbi:uncharacterized protein LACBIDRAFT_319136 [Laccaria bicolor S238N-H82]|uniref:Predicted protein n=1 Tax=Laccaria bicolor (strain S238N-H82 / ATCC MYA-4686) TaxID=486041 RepID=B0D7Y7_LACBS|nr:uncharacterized protein LACBIDRAFT_319136 [Laccaria bicolor S238N-H82]EDR09726.1 predicted protein [Laccaria bicolor S238N-H82]|eukprot:XP_001880075.1 predicted protein [Laccaria bicolor S238N-H82]